jgi:hypothetical protein
MRMPRVRRSYPQICAEFTAFENEFIPKNNLHLLRLFELCFFVGAASSVEQPDEDLMMRITTTLSLVEYDRDQHMKTSYANL